MRLGWLAILCLAACGRLDFARHDASLCDTAMLASGLVGHWALDDGQGLTAVDTAAGHDATLLGGPTWSASDHGGALAFDGVDDHADVAGNVVYATSGRPFSFAAWFNLDDYSTTTPDIMQIRSDTPSPFHVLMSSMPQYLGLSLGSGDGLWVPQKTNLQPSTGVWHHIVVIYDGAGAATIASYQIILDGALQTAVPAAGYGTQAQQSRIGAAEDPKNNWIGLIDDVRIYDRELAAVEIDALGAGCL